MTCMTRLIHVSTIIQDAGRILLVQEAKQQNRELWNLPGGHLEEDETLHQGALREVFEETGLHVVPVTTSSPSAGQRRKRSLPFRIRNCSVPQCFAASSPTCNTNL
jgi:ADP-ribose pyrophosphatase YjhB (NUDIX family)